MTILMEALRTFVGMEGFITRGTQFNVSTNERAKQLSEVGLAKMIDTSNVEEEPIQEVPSSEVEKETEVPEATVSLIKPVSMEMMSEPNPIPSNHMKPTIIWTGDPNKVLSDESSKEKSSFEDEVEYVGGGWYQLPNGDSIQGKESALEEWEKSK